jgi:hypothetical protein
MVFDTASILARIDSEINKAQALISSSKYEDLSDLRRDERTFEVLASLLSTIEALAPPGSAYQTLAHARHDSVIAGAYTSIKPVKGIVQSLRDAYAQGYLQNVRELIHADVFSDFLEMAEHLLNEGYKDAAAVICGSVLEEHLRKLCVKNSITTTRPDGSPKKADTLNGELGTANAYSKLDLKSITGWLDLRNSAAHGHYGNYTKEQATLMLQSVRDFISRNPA